MPTNPLHLLGLDGDRLQGRLAGTLRRRPACGLKIAVGNRDRDEDRPGHVGLGSTTRLGLGRRRLSWCRLRRGRRDDDGRPGPDLRGGVGVGRLLRRPLRGGVEVASYGNLQRFRPRGQRRGIRLGSIKFHRDVHRGALQERQRLPNLAGEVVLVSDLFGQRRIGTGDRRHLPVRDRFERPDIDAAAPQIGDRHSLWRQSGDRRTHKHADRLHAGRVEFHVGLRADIHAGGLGRAATFEAVMAFGVVEHRGPLDAGHRTDDQRQFLLRGHPQQLALHCLALPGAVFLECTAEAATELPRQRLGIDQGPHVGALPTTRHPDPATVGAVVGELSPIEGRFHDRHLGRRQGHAGKQFDLFARRSVAEQPDGPAHRCGNEPERDHLSRRHGQRETVSRRRRGLLCVHALPFVTGN